MCLPSAKNVFHSYRGEKHQKVKSHKKYVVKKEIRHKHYKETLFGKKNSSDMKWTCSPARGMRFMGFGWIKSRWAHSIQSDISQKTALTHAYGYWLTDKELKTSLWSCRRKNGVWVYNQQLLTYEAPFGPILQIIQYRFIWSGDRFFNVVHFQEPHGISSTFATTFQLIRLVEITHVHKGGKFFFTHYNRSVIRSKSTWWTLFAVDTSNTRGRVWLEIPSWPSERYSQPGPKVLQKREQKLLWKKRGKSLAKKLRKGVLHN